MLIWAIGVIAFLIMIVILFGASISVPGHKGPASPHFNGKTFVNLNGKKAKGFKDVFKWMVKRDQGAWRLNYETEVGPKPAKDSEEMLITFVNHSTFLIQWNHLNILTDPVWSERCSPFSFVGPRRMRPPGIRFADLPSIDIVLLSHNHYDHLDIHTVKKIEEKHSPVFVMPLGIKAYLHQHQIKNCIELDWWQKTNPGILVQSVPAQHFSGRGMFDRDKTLWCGYVLEHDNKRLYFAGDSGYGEFFREIGKKAGPMDVSLIPIGAYEPKWFMSSIHISPQESINVHKDVKSTQSIASHFGTFPLADDGQGKAEEDLILALANRDIPQKEFIIPEEGVPMKF